MKKKIGWGILGTVAASIISLVVYAAPAWELKILGVYFAVVGRHRPLSGDRGIMITQ